MSTKEKIVMVISCTFVCILIMFTNTTDRVNQISNVSYDIELNKMHKYLRCRDAKKWKDPYMKAFALTQGDCL